jgi:hypothetical protein
MVLPTDCSLQTTDSKDGRRQGNPSRCRLRRTGRQGQPARQGPRRRRQEAEGVRRERRRAGGAAGRAGRGGPGPGRRHGLPLQGRRRRPQQDGRPHRRLDRGPLGVGLRRRAVGGRPGDARSGPQGDAAEPRLGRRRLPRDAGHPRQARADRRRPEGPHAGRAVPVARRPHRPGRQSDTAGRPGDGRLRQERPEAHPAPVRRGEGDRRVAGRGQPPRAHGRHGSGPVRRRPAGRLEPPAQDAQGPPPSPSAGHSPPT